MNWRELKEFCNSLDEKQLDNNVLLFQEETVISRIKSDKIESDLYIGDGDEMCYSLEENNLKIEDVTKFGLVKVYEKGEPILFQEF